MSQRVERLASSSVSGVSVRVVSRMSQEFGFRTRAETPPCRVIFRMRSAFAKPFHGIDRSRIGPAVDRAGVKSFLREPPLQTLPELERPDLRMQGSATARSPRISFPVPAESDGRPRRHRVAAPAGRNCRPSPDYEVRANRPCRRRRGNVSAPSRRFWAGRQARSHRNNRASLRRAKFPWWLRSHRHWRLVPGRSVSHRDRVRNNRPLTVKPFANESVPSLRA